MKEEMMAVLRAMAGDIKEIRSVLADPNHGLAAIRLKLGMVTDDHDAALLSHDRRLRALEPQVVNGHGSNGQGHDAE